MKFSLLMKIFITVIVFSIIPIIFMSSYFSFLVMGYTEGEIIKSDMEKMDLVNSILVQLGDSLIQDATRISTNRLMDELYGIENYYSKSRNAGDIIVLSQVLDLLDDITKTNGNIQSVYLYLDNADYVLISGVGILTKESFADTGWIDGYKAALEKKQPLTWKGRRIQDQSVSNYVITYICPLTPYTTNLRGAVVFNIKEDQICSIANNKKTGSEGYIYILDGAGNVVSHPDKTFLGSNLSHLSYIKQIQVSRLDKSHIIQELDGKRQVMTYIKSDFNNLTFIGVLSLDVLMDKANILRLRILYIALIMVIIVILTSYVISLRIYNPMRKLIQMIQTQKKFEFGKKEDEMSVISKIFYTITKKEEQLFNILSKNKVNIKERYLQELLNGNLMEDVDSDITGIDFTMQYFFCIYVVIDKYNSITLKYSPEHQYYLKSVFLKVCEEILGTSYKCAGTIHEKERIVIIVNTDDKNSLDDNRLIKSKLKVILEEVKKAIDNTVSFGIGSIYHGREGIMNSFAEASNAIKYKMVNGFGSVNLWADVQKKEFKYYYPYIKEKHIMSCLNAGLRDGLFSAVDGLVCEIKRKDNLSLENIAQIFYQLIGNVIKHIVDLSINLCEVFGDEYNLYEKISKCETLDEIQTNLFEIYTCLLEYNQKCKTEQYDYFGRIKKYIHENFHKDIDIGAMADHIGISYSYVRKIFFEKTGRNIVEYVNGLRIKESKRLLNNTNMNIKEIAAFLGYNSDHSFNRNFKRLEGITPGEFRVKA
jgi:AraC-like DNA-binding protein